MENDFAGISSYNYANNDPIKLADPTGMAPIDGPGDGNGTATNTGNAKPKASEQGEPFFFIKSSGCFEKIFYDEIIYVKALQNYVDIYTDTKRHTCYLTLKNVEEYLPAEMFIKVNKSCIVSIPKIDKISGNDIHIGSQLVSIAKSNKDNIVNAIINNRLLTRR